MADRSLDLEAWGKLISELRPRLHRYCARMVGSAIDGEDVTQEALTKATQSLAAAGRIERPEAWVFRIAHNAALDALRRRQRQNWASSDDELADVADPAGSADARVAAGASLASFMRLPAAQRSSMILIDVLGHSAEETAEILDVTLAAIKAALHRGRTRLRNLADASDEPTAPLDLAERKRLRAYADRFNAHDFDALRALLAEDVRLDLYNRRHLVGKEVGLYFTHYGQSSGWRVSPCLVEGRGALLMDDPAAEAQYIMLLDWTNGRIARIRDFRFAPYVMEGLIVSGLPNGQ
jgi:RNA polymerase sigma-70 factor (ECF subfamily)